MAHSKRNPRVSPADIPLRLAASLRRALSGMRRLRTSRWHRRHAIRRLLALATTLVVLVYVRGLKAAAEESRANWSAEASAVVVTSVIRPGEEIDSSNTTTEARPAEHVPPGAISRLPEEPLVASAAMEPGEVLIAGRTTQAETDLAPGRSAMTVDATTAAHTLSVGQHVDVLGTVLNSTPGPDGLPPVAQVATDAVILEVVEGDTPSAIGGGTATLSVRSADVLDLGKATLNGPVVLVIRSG